MCRPFSCLVISDLSVIVGQKVTQHSHSEIMRQHGLPQEISIDQYAKVELVPSADHPADPDKWELKLDEDRTPSWWECNLPEIVDRVRQAAWKWLAKIKAKTEFCLDEGDFLHLPFGSPAVRMPGGKLRAFGDSAPVVTLTGGELRAYGQSAPVVTLTGGELLACGQSAPVVTMTGGDLVADGSSAPVVRMSGGKLRAFGDSAPVVTMTGGWLMVWNRAAPVVNGVAMKPWQRATIENGDLVIKR